MSIYLVSVYDINEERVSKVHKIIKKYLIWQQNSTFEGYITQGNFKKLKRELYKVIKKDEDNIIFYIFNSKNNFVRLDFGVVKTKFEGLIIK